MHANEKPKTDPSGDGDDANNSSNGDDANNSSDGEGGGDSAKSPRLNMSTEAIRSKSEQDLGRAHSLLDLLAVC